MTEIPTALLNLEDGTLVRPKRGGDEIDLSYSQYYDWDRLRRSVQPCVGNAPVVLMICEGKEWGRYGSSPLNAAAEILSDELVRTYVGYLGWHPAGDYAPAIFYDPQVLCPRYWGNVHDSVPLHWRNVLTMALRPRARRRTLVRFAVGHHDFQSGLVRLLEMENKGYLAELDIATMFTGDFNETASGNHLPQRNWMEASIKKRRHKGKKLDKNEWGPQTDSIDYLIGEWDEEDQCRYDGIGFHALCEIAHFAQGMPAKQAFLPTLNNGVEAGGGLLIDWMTVNEAWADGLVPDTYTVHVPPGERREDFPTNHRLVTATMRI